MSNDDRPKLSWAEIDKRRDGSSRGRDQGDRRPRGKAEEARDREVKDDALEKADALFSLEKGGHEGEGLGKAMRDAHGSPAFLDSCREYREGVGMPTDPALLSLFLDTGEPDFMVAALESLLALQAAGEVEFGSGLKSQIRTLAGDFNNDVAELAEELVEGL